MTDILLRPIVSTIGSPTYALAKHLAKVIAPLAGQTSSFIKNSTDFTQKINDMTIHDDRPIMVSFDMKSLFTNVPVPDALPVLRRKLEQDEMLPEQMTMSIDSILMLLITYFTYEGEFYQQSEGAAMGYPLSPILANQFMEEFEEEAALWLRYVNNTFVLWRHGKDKLKPFLTHLNSR